MNRFRMAALALLAIMGLLAACTPASTPTPTSVPPTDTPIATATATAASTVASTSAATAASGGATSAATMPASGAATAAATSAGGSSGSAIGALASPTNGAAGNPTGGVTASGPLNNGTAAAAGGTSAANQAALDPCVLVTRNDVEGALGIQVESPQPDTGQNGIRTCQYVVPSTTTPITVGVTVYQGGSQLDVVRNLMAGGQSVDGMGMAVIQVNTGLFIQVRSDAYVGIAVSIPNNQNQANQAQRTLAQQAIQRLTASAKG